MVKTETPHDKDEKSSCYEFLMKIFLILGLYVCFIFSGIYEEKLYKTNYSVDSLSIKFNNPSIAILANSLIAYLIAQFALLMYQKEENNPLKTSDKAILGTYFILCRFSSEHSLNYLDFVSKIIGKSCKSVSSKKFFI